MKERFNMMNATALHVLRELIRQHHERHANTGKNTPVPAELRFADIVRFARLPAQQVEDALETLVELRILVRHSLGQFTLTRTALDEYGLVVRTSDDPE